VLVWHAKYLDFDAVIIIRFNALNVFVLCFKSQCAVQTVPGCDEERQSHLVDILTNSALLFANFMSLTLEDI